MIYSIVWFTEIGMKVFPAVTKHQTDAFTSALKRILALLTHFGLGVSHLLPLEFFPQLPCSTLHHSAPFLLMAACLKDTTRNWLMLAKDQRWERKQAQIKCYLTTQRTGPVLLNKILKTTPTGKVNITNYCNNLCFFLSKLYKKKPTLEWTPWVKVNK